MYICIRTYMTYIMCVCMYVRTRVCMCQVERRMHTGRPVCATRGSQLAHSSGRSGRKCCCAEAGRLPPLFVCELSAGVLLAPRNNITISIRAAVVATATGLDGSKLSKNSLFENQARERKFYSKSPIESCLRLISVFPPPPFSLPIAYIHRIQS